MKRWLPIFLLAFVFTGCSTTLTNLTPRHQVRNASNMYPLEVAWDTTQRTIVDDTVQASVIVGDDIYPMQKTPIVKDRWETLVPLPEGRNYLHYRFKFDYEYRALHERRPGSNATREYRLDIIDQ